MPSMKRSTTPVRKRKKRKSTPLKKIFNIPINDFSFFFVPFVFFIICSIIFKITGEPPLKNYSEGTNILIPIVGIIFGIIFFEKILDFFL